MAIDNLVKEIYDANVEAQKTKLLDENVRLTFKNVDGGIAFLVEGDVLIEAVSKAAAQKLYDFENAEEDGLLVRLPCKVGDTVYAIMLNDDEEKEVVLLQIDRFLVYENNEVEIEAYIPSNIAVWDGFTIDIKNIGKTVFLTREAAEAALKERDNK